MAIKNVRNLVKACLNHFGYDVHKLKPADVMPTETFRPPFHKIHYACYKTYLDGWLNVDILKSGPPNYMYVNLVTKHPFEDNYFRFAFSEDFIEHIEQADAIAFLSEVFRTLKSGGVFRLSSPNLEAVLDEHYVGGDFDTLIKAKDGAYNWHGHRHFFTKESLVTIAGHIGFRVKFVQMRQSEHRELAELDTRIGQANMNVIAELTKP